jgi:ABC-type uncharacterized transport system substrate-binding protein
MLSSNQWGHMGFNHLKRREFITLLGGAAAAWPVAARAQQLQRMRRIGMLMAWPESDSEAQARAVALREELQTLGWTEGRNLHIEYRWGAINPDAVKMHAAELIDLAPDVIVTSNTVAAQTLRRSPRQLSIVFVGIADPVGSGVVASLAKPGGNATGLTAYEPAITGKWLSLLKEIAPRVQLPVQAPTKFELVIDLKTVKALGLTVPLTLQASADEVIE